MDLKASKLCICLACMMFLGVSCDSGTDVESGTTQGSNQFPSGPDYSTLDSRSVEGILLFEEPFMEAVSLDWDNKRVDNGAVSPLSAACVMGMLANGMNEKGREDVMKFFRLDGSDLETLNTTMSSIITSIVHKAYGSNLCIYNSVWGHADSEIKLQFEQQFVENMKKYYNADVDKADLRTPTSDLSSHPLNRWAKKQIGEECNFFVPSYEKLVTLANILTFAADWERKFEKTNTSKRDFKNLDGSSSSVDFMSGDQNIIYGISKAGTYIILYYKNVDLRFKVFIPNEGQSINDFSVFDLKKHEYAFGSGDTRLIIPKFDIEVDNDFRDVIKNLGLSDAFVDKDGFPNMIVASSIPAKVTDFMEFKQKVRVSVAEEGTKATVVSFVYNGVYDHLDRIPDEVIVDQPFLFEIEAYRQTIIAGRITKL